MSATGEASNLILLSQRKQLLSTTYVMVYLFVFLQMIINFDDALYLAGMDSGRFIKAKVVKTIIT